MRLFVLLLCLGLLLVPDAHGQTSNVALSDKETWIPPVKTSYWGNIDGVIGATSDAKVNIKDLVELAKSQRDNSAKQKYGRPLVSILADMKKHWQFEVPRFLRDMPVAIDRELVGYKQPPGEAKKSDDSEEKLIDDLPLSLGLGISFGTNGDMKPGEQIYTAERSEWVALTTYEGGMYTANETYNADYASTYLEEAEAKGIDLSLEYKYAAFNGSLSSRFQRNTYSDMTTHKYIIRDAVDYGWWELPANLRDSRILPGFTEAINDPAGEANLPADYGTHYVSSAHLLADIVVEVNIRTRTRHDQSSFEAQVNAAYNSFSTYASLAAGVQQASRSLEQEATITVKIETRGGPSPVTLNDGTEIPNPLVITPDDNLLQKIPEIVEAWRRGANKDNAQVIDWYVKPMTVFIPTTAVEPFSKAAAMRGWFKRFVEFSEMRDKMNSVITKNQATGEYGYIPPFSYLSQMPSPEGFPYENLKDYHIFVYDHYNSNFAKLLSVGRELYTGSRDTFAETPEEIEAFTIYSPMVYPLFISNNGTGLCSACEPSEYAPDYCVPNVNLLAEGGNYAVELWGDEPGTICNQSMPVSIQWHPPGEGSAFCQLWTASGVTEVSGYKCTPRGNINCCTWDGTPILGGMTIRDSISGKLIGYAVPPGGAANSYLRAALQQNN